MYKHKARMLQEEKGPFSDVTGQGTSEEPGDRDTMDG